MPLVLAIDLGTSSVKVQVIDGTGAALGEAAHPYPTERPAPGRAEQSPGAWWRATVAASRAALAASGRVGRDVAAIGVTGQMHGTVLVDGAGATVGPAIIWSDQRAAALVPELTEAVGADRVAAVTGGPLAAGYQAVTIAWLARERPADLDRARLVLLPKDWVRSRLTGESATEPSDAGATGLFDIRSRRWSAEMAAAVGIAVERLPPVIGSADRAGGLTAEAASDLGLTPGTPVAAGAGDSLAAALGAGVTRPGDFLVTLSTGTQALAPIADLPDGAAGAGQIVCSALSAPDGAAWAVVTATLNTGSALRWAATAFGFGDDRALLRAAASATSADGGPLFIPYLGGERAPWYDAAARGTLLGLTADHGPAGIARAVVEGITLAGSLAWSRVAPPPDPPTAVTLAGGGGRDGWWRHLVADAYGLPVRYDDRPDQSARGAAALALAMLGGASPTDIVAGWPNPTAEVLSPNPDRHADLLRRQALLEDAYLALKPVTDAL